MQAEADLTAAGITETASIPDIDTGLHTYTSKVTAEAQKAAQQGKRQSRASSPDSRLSRSAPGESSTLKQAAEDPDLQFFWQLDGYSADTPKTWALLEGGLKNYLRLLQERASAMTQA